METFFTPKFWPAVKKFTMTRAPCCCEDNGMRKVSYNCMFSLFLNSMFTFWLLKRLENFPSYSYTRQFSRLISESFCFDVKYSITDMFNFQKWTIQFKNTPQRWYINRSRNFREKSNRDENQPPFTLATSQDFPFCMK